jgi:hypothetical protein
VKPVGDDYDKLYNTSGIVVITRADYDGWPQGMPVKYVGPFPNWDAYQHWKKQEYGHGSGWHFAWHVLKPPEGLIIEEE